MRRSIKRQLAFILVGLIVVMQIIFQVMDTQFLGNYYIYCKQKELVHVYEVLLELEEEGGFEEEIILEGDTKATLLRLTEDGNISFLVMNNEFSQFQSNVYEISVMEKRLAEYVFGGRQSSSEVLKETEDYQIYRFTDSAQEGVEYMEIWGNLGTNHKFIMRTSLESIENSVTLSNRFLLYIGITLIIFAIFVAELLSRRISRPILKLAEISNRMARLDFDARYEGRVNNELDELGENFNAMSDQLQAVISELKTANNELQLDLEKRGQIEKMRTEFLSNVSHELKTPISLIQGYAEGLRDGISKKQEDQEFYCEVILDEAMKMNQMVSSLLTLNQLEFGDEEIVFVRFNLVEMIQSTLKAMGILLEQKGITVHFSNQEAVYVWCDEMKAEQVVRNYISNAIHHAEGKKEITITVQCKKDKAKVSVFNTGAPIPAEDVPHIWDKFYKVDKARTRSYGGNGIGLAIVKAIMESIHQEYGVLNHKDGVEFWFCLDIH